MSEKPAALYYQPRADVTFYWQRGAGCMLVHRGNCVAGSSGPVVGKVAVPAGGWIDQAEVRARAEAWLAEHNGRPSR